ncbi:MAG: putative Ig domain-containing protein [Cyanobacteria bacterium J06631_2]
MNLKIKYWFYLIVAILISCNGGINNSHIAQAAGDYSSDISHIPRNGDRKTAKQNSHGNLIANNSIPSTCKTATIKAGTEYSCMMSGVGEGKTFSLDNAPLGMVIQSSGYLHWTPTNSQAQPYTVTINRYADGQKEGETELKLTVEANTAQSSPGIYISPKGSDKNTGAIDSPLASLHKAASIAKPGDTIFLRGGTYFNAGHGTSFVGRRNNLARITNSGSSDKWITIRPHGNEYVKLKSDVNGIVFKGAAYWRVQGLELEGTTFETEKTSLKLWWDDTEAANQVTGRGIAMNSSHQIEITDSIVHDFPGAGISNNGGADISMTDSIVYNNAWWSTAGTHGFANSKPATKTKMNQSSFKMTMKDNLVFGNQSSVISHVFSKGFVKLEIDEGNGLHMQNTEGDFYGRFLAENNLVMYNGKAGLGLNTIANSTIRNNSFYQNAQAVHSSGELSLQAPTSGNSQPNVIEKNLFQALEDRDTIKVFKQADPYEGVKDNYAVPAADATELTAAHVNYESQVFTNPANFDFSPVSSISADYGVPHATLDRLQAKLKEYGITPKPAATKVTESYLKKMKMLIFRKWPAPNPNDSIPDNLILEDGATGLCYTYEQRREYPAPPKTFTPCKKK